MPTAGADLRSMAMVTALRSISALRVTMGAGMVALKNSVWRLAGRCLRIFRISGRNPMSSMRSASSSTSTSRPPNFTYGDRR